MRRAFVLLIAAAALTVGALFGWPELVGGGAGLVVLVLGAVTFRRPHGARWWDVDVPVRVPRCDPAVLRIGVGIDGSDRWVRAVDARGRCHLWPDGRSEISWPVETGRRGEFEVGPVRLEHGDPWGLRTVVLARRPSSRVLVVPRVLPVDGLRLASPADGRWAEHTGHDQVQSIREYAVGDPLKLVHWRSSAKVGSLMVRRLVDATTPTVLVVLDVDERSYASARLMHAEVDPEAFEEAVDLAASWSWSSADPSQRTIVTTTAADEASIEVTPASRESALDWLAHVQPVHTDRCAPGRIGELARRTGAGGLVLVTGPNTRVGAVLERMWSSIAPVLTVRVP